MPYKKPKTAHIGLRELCLSKGIRSPQLADILDCSVNTALKKLKEPKYMTIEDLDKLHYKGHLTWKEIKERGLSEGADA